jgi:hypothetical protein
MAHSKLFWVWMNYLYDLFCQVTLAHIDILIDMETEYLLFNGHEKSKAAD